jgi:hypothetical protein
MPTGDSVEIYFLEGLRDKAHVRATTKMKLCGLALIVVGLFGSSKVKGPKGILTELPHAPVARATLERSVTKLSKSNVSFPDFQPGYDEWKSAKGGVFNVSVAEIVSFVEQAFSGAKRKP